MGNASRKSADHLAKAELLADNPAVVGKMGRDGGKVEKSGDCSRSAHFVEQATFPQCVGQRYRINGLVGGKQAHHHSGNGSVG